MNLIIWYMNKKRCNLLKPTFNWINVFSLILEKDQSKEVQEVACSKQFLWLEVFFLSVLGDSCSDENLITDKYCVAVPQNYQEQISFCLITGQDCRSKYFFFHLITHKTNVVRPVSLQSLLVRICCLLKAIEQGQSYVIKDN